jgi:hypothetical protein
MVTPPRALARWQPVPLPRVGDPRPAEARTVWAPANCVEAPSASPRTAPARGCPVTRPVGLGQMAACASAPRRRSPPGGGADRMGSREWHRGAVRFTRDGPDPGGSLTPRPFPMAADLAGAAPAGGLLSDGDRPVLPGGAWSAGQHGVCGQEGPTLIALTVPAGTAMPPAVISMLTPSRDRTSTTSA